MKHIIMAIVFSVALLDGQMTAAATLQRQTLFCEEGEPQSLILKPTPLPSAGITALMSTREGKEASKLARSEGEALDPATLFKAAKVRLTESGDLFFVVLGSSPMSGADNTWFWVVGQSGTKATILFICGCELPGDKPEKHSRI